MRPDFDSEEQKAYRRTLKDGLPPEERAKINKRIHRNILFLHRMFTYNYNIGLSEFDICSQKAFHRNIDSKILETFFSREEFRANSARRLFDSPGPLFLTHSLGLVYVLISHFDSQGLIQYYCALGPVFTNENNRSNVSLRLQQYPLSAELRLHLTKTLPSLPVMPLQTLVEYAIMMHGCINNEKITPGDIHYNYTMASSYPDEEKADKENLLKNKALTYAVAAKKLQDAIRMGDTAYVSHMGPSLFHDLNFSPAFGISHLRLIRDFCIMITNNCFSAAVRGGLPITETYDLLGNYLYAFEQAKTEADMYRILSSMELDFATRVKHIRVSSNRNIIDECCYYIDSHLSKDLKLETVARELNYSPNYLGKLFHESLGMSFRDYLTGRKLEKARGLLALGQLSVAQVAEQCHFSSSSYFCKVFVRHMGITPQEYARNNAKNDI